MHLVDHARAHIEETYRRPPQDRLTRWLLAAILPYPTRMRVALALAIFGKPFAPLLALLGLKPLAALLRLSPAGRLPQAVPQRTSAPRKVPARAGWRCCRAAPIACWALM